MDGFFFVREESVKQRATHPHGPIRINRKSDTLALYPDKTKIFMRCKVGSVSSIKDGASEAKAG